MAKSNELKLIDDLKEQIRDLKRQLMVADRLRHDAVKKQKTSTAAWDGRLLASGVAHEFNNILGAADGHAEWALESGNIDDMKEALDIIREACSRSLHITKSLQGLVGPSEEDAAVFDLTLTLQSLAKHFSKVLEKKNIKLSIECESVTFFGNESRFYEVLLNLVKNASESIQGAASKIQIEGKVVKNNKYSLKVKDNGAGIPELFHERIFEAFFTTKGQLAHIHQNSDDNEASLGAADSGSGLGLYLSRSIIEEMGGRIKLLKVKSGACFELVLPIASKDEESTKSSK